MKERFEPKIGNLKDNRIPVSLLAVNVNNDHENLEDKTERYINRIEKNTMETKNENTTEKELSSEQKRSLGEVWTNLVVNGGGVTENISEMNEGEIKKWFFDSIMRDIDSFVEELGIKIDAELIFKIQRAKDLGEKSELELEYIKKIHDEVCNITSSFDESHEKGTKWDSWPKRMRETKEFNCVGATLVGMNLLKRAGIKSYYGNPYGHVLNIVQLPNDEWWYADFRNGKGGMMKIEPEEILIEGVSVLKINHPRTDYRLIPIYDNSESVGSILGNLSSIKQNAEKQDISNDSIDTREAKEYFEAHRGDFQKTDFAFLHRFLYPKFDVVNASKEMQEEEARIRKDRDVGEPILRYSKTLSNEQLISMFQEMKDKKEIIAQILNSGSTLMLGEFSSESRKALELYLSALERLKERDPEFYRETLNRLISKIRSL